jgi:hypothetical protein
VTDALKVADIVVEGRAVRVARLADDKYDTPDDPAAAIETVRGCGSRVDLFTFMQKLPETAPKYDFPMEWDNVATLYLTTFDHWWTDQIKSRVRTKVRKAEKAGVVTREAALDDELLHGISRLYDETPVRQGRRFRHYGKDLATVRAVNGSFVERSTFVGAYLGTELIGFAKLIADRDATQLGIAQILALLRYRDAAVTNALVAHAVRLCTERGFSVLHYGPLVYGKKRGDGLSEFKRHNGFSRVDVPRYFIPFTQRGSAALRLGLHRPLVHRLPEPVAARLRDVRARWYARQAE